MVRSTGIKKLKSAIFISGNGSNMKNLFNFSKKKKSPIVVDLVISSNKSANGVQFLKKNKIYFEIFNFKKKKNSTNLSCRIYENSLGKFY